MGACRSCASGLPGYRYRLPLGLGPAAAGKSAALYHSSFGALVGYLEGQTALGSLGLQSPS